MDVDRVKFSYFRNAKLFAPPKTGSHDVISAGIGTEVNDLKKCVMYELENEEVSQ